MKLNLVSRKAICYIAAYEMTQGPEPCLKRLLICRV